MMDGNKRPQLDERGLPVGYPFQEGLEVTPRQLHAMRVQGEDFELIDCRTLDEYEHVRLDNSTLIPLQQLNAYAQTLLPMAQRRVIILCHHGGRSMKMAQVLRANGFTDVKSVAGGIHLWAQDIDPTLPTY